MPESEGDFAGRYAPMSEMELMDLAREYDRLSEPAQAALRVEFAGRGLEPPLVEESGMEVEGRKLVTVARFRDMPEAFVARAVLEDAGIQCHLADEYLVRMDWLWSNLIGGMRLQVLAEDEERALSLLSSPSPSRIEVEGESDFVQPVCPVCASSDVALNDSGRKAAAVSLISLLYFGVPLPFWRSKRRGVWRCESCGHQWSGER